VTGLHVDVYPRSSAAGPEQETGTLLIERPGTRFAVYRRSI
jgi:hypothetical protein